MSRFDGKMVIVTGAAGALGRSMVRGFAAEGARVAAGARREEQVADLVAELGDRAPFAALDPRREGLGRGGADRRAAVRPSGRRPRQ